MNKITTGLFGLVATLAIVAGTAFALFSDEVTVSGFALTTGDANLEISLVTEEGTPASYSDSLDLSSLSPFGTLVPGEDDWGEFFLRNNSSTEGVDEIDLDLTAQLSSASGDWSSLRDQIELVVYLEGNSPEDGLDFSTDWLTLETWNAGPVDLPGSPLSEGEEKHYILRFKLKEDATESLEGLTLSDIVFTIDGTQVDPTP